VIFYHTPEQKEIAKEVMAKIEAAKIWDAPVVTEITAFKTFYPAENYHQEYFLHNPDQPYCSVVIEPKVAKFRKQFFTKLKK
jgi:peptide-methionine (S)-S-oxide reductase